MIETTDRLRLSSADDAYVSLDDINASISSMADFYNTEVYQNTPNITTLTILDGAKRFSEALIPLLQPEVTRDEMTAKSMEGTESTGKLNIISPPSTDLEGKDVLIIEDLLDTGLTLSGLVKYVLEIKKARSLQIAALFEKPGNVLPGIKLENIRTGIRVHPKAFIIGFGLDWNNKYRDLDYLTTAVEAAPGHYEPAVKLAA